MAPFEWHTVERAEPALAYHLGEHVSGLRLHLVPRPGFSRIAVALGVHAGSNAREVEYRDREAGDGATERRTVFPAGTAHFLEHQFFRGADGVDKSERFVEHSLSLNAYTAPGGTLFAVSGAGGGRNATWAAKALADLMPELAIDAASVTAERSIIEQEIRRELDDPQFVLDNAVGRAAYPCHPIGEDVLGTVDSIRAIDEPTLRRFHALAYRPEHATLVVVADTTPDDLDRALEPAVARWAADPSLARIEPGAIRFSTPDDTDPPAQRKVQLTRRAAHRMLSWCIKLDPQRHRPASAPASSTTDATGLRLTTAHGFAALTRSYGASLFLLSFLGQSSRLRETLEHDGLIFDAFSAAASCHPHYEYVDIGGEIPDPLALHARLLDAIAAWRVAPDTSHLAALRRQQFGHLVRVHDSFEALASTHVLADRFSLSPFESFDVLEHVGDKDAVAFGADLADAIDQGRDVLGILEPMPVPAPA